MHLPFKKASALASLFFLTTGINFIPISLNYVFTKRYFQEGLYYLFFLHKAFYKPGQTVQVCELKVHLRNI